MKITHRTSAGLLVLTSAMLIGLRAEAQEGRTSEAATRPGAQPSVEMLPAQFQATVYEVQAVADRLGGLDEKVLSSQAATPETLVSALAQTGKARLLYHVEQPVNVFSTRIITGSSEPVISGTRKTTTGGTVNSINYQNVGFIVRLSAESPPSHGNGPARIVKTAIQLSVLSPGEKEIAPGQKESATRIVSLDHSAPFELDRPQVLLTISSNAVSGFRRSADGRGRAEAPITPVAYVVRYQFSPPAPGSPAVETKPAALVREATETARSTNTLIAQFQATVYEVEAATNRLPALDMRALARAATPELLLAALRDAGKPRVLYRIDQPVNVFSDEVLIQTNKPIVAGTRMGSDGKPINSYTSHNMGVSVRLSAKAPPEHAEREGPDVTISFNVSADAPGNTDFGFGEMAMSFPMISQEHNEPLEPGRRRVMVAMGASSAAEQAKPFVYVVCYQFGLPGTK